jgi:hypothetical protein
MSQASFILFTAFTIFPDGPGREIYPLFGAFPPAINLLCIGLKPVQSFFAVEG